MFGGEKIHLILLIQENLPHDYSKSNNEIDKFINKIRGKKYEANRLHPSWNCIRPREMRLFDLTFPGSEKERVLTDLSAFSTGKIEKLSKILNAPIIGKAIQSATGVKYVDMDKYRKIAIKEGKHKKDVGVSISVLCMVEDNYDEKGLEQI